MAQSTNAGLPTNEPSTIIEIDSTRLLSNANLSLEEIETRKQAITEFEQSLASAGPLLSYELAKNWADLNDGSLFLESEIGRKYHLLAHHAKQISDESYWRSGKPAVYAVLCDRRTNLTNCVERPGEDNATSGLWDEESTYKDTSAILNELYRKVKERMTNKKPLTDDELQFLRTHRVQVRSLPPGSLWAQLSQKQYNFDG
uniref:Uncharacterized protein n=1 Tax=Kwoniella dejecticola CBS 10117 TaxID=1296121 RepID=A0A1A5ZV61_9TREE|nr:uncharacterized protein I303_07607 [Kwoniella dejecticola CBS 10117]OBR81697.1 hypothetical protein I303_07607 [Kwoniella dejecticola CBS 10117]